MMNVLLQRVIRNWERSGQGDGGITGDDDLDDDIALDATSQREATEDKA